MLMSLVVSEIVHRTEGFHDKTIYYLQKIGILIYVREM